MRDLFPPIFLPLLREKLFIDQALRSLVCGINLILDRSQKLDTRPIQAMNQRLYHRGPDAEGIYHYQAPSFQLFLGNTRLSICDPVERSNQPFISSNQRFVLAFNGQIYNYRDLKKKLGTSYGFRTTSDTEVLLYWLAQGIRNQAYWSAYDALEGMYAFLLWDAQQEKLYYGRDGQHIKPLYVCETGTYLIFSSEIQGILSTRLIKATLNPNAPRDYLRYRYPQAPHTFYKGVYEVMQGGQIEIHASKSIDWGNPGEECTGYFPQQDISGLGLSPSSLLQKVEASLLQSIKARIPSDVPWGLFLSGGVDSTLLLALLRELGYQDFPAFILTYAPSLQKYATQDGRFAQMAAQQYGAERLVLEMGPSDLLRLPEFIGSLDQPWGDPASFLSYLLAEKASQYTKVCFSGAGADEYFAGYNRHLAYARYLQLRPFSPVFPWIKRLGKVLPGGAKGPARKYFRLLRRFTEGLDTSPQRTFEHFLQLQILPGQAQPEEVPVPYDFLDWAFKLDQKNYLRRNVLGLTDRAAMQHSLEVRVPYLDQGITQLANSIPAPTRLRPHKKWILRQILEKYEGKAYTQRPKEGFGMPWGYWIKQDKYRWVQEEILHPANPLFEYVPTGRVQSLVEDHWKGHRDFSHEIWALWSLSYFLRSRF